MNYEVLEPISREEAERLLDGCDPETICRTLVRVAMFEPDRRWAQSQCLRFARNRNAWIRGVAATCLGHLARIHRVIDEDEVIPVMRELLRDADSRTRAKTEDALSDFSIYLGWNKRKLRRLHAA